MTTDTNERIEALEEAKKHFVFRVGYATKKLDEFAKRFSEAPANAFEWSNSAPGHAADLEVAQRIIELLDKAIERGDTRADVGHRVLRESLRQSTDSSISTSATCNLINNERRRAWAEAASRLNDIGRWEI